MTRFRALLVTEPTAGRERGTFRADLAPEVGAVLLISLVQGLAIRWTMGQRAFSLKTEGARLLSSQIALFRYPQDSTTPDPKLPDRNRTDKDIIQ